MGKILKYCSSCDEGFADKFQFCPNCGASLQAFEMNPVAAAEPKVPEEIRTAAPPPAREVKATPPPAPAFIESEPQVEPPPPVQAGAPVELPKVKAAPVEKQKPIEQPKVAENDRVVEEKAKPTVAAVSATTAPVFYQAKPMYADEKPVSLEDAHSQAQRDGGYYLTVIEDKNVGTRNSLLLGAAIFMSVVLLSGLVINIFSQDLDVGSIDDAMFNAVLVDSVPDAVEQEKQQKKDKDAGGGGGGGRQQDETTLGDRANQTPNPQRPPEAMPRLENPSLTLPPASTQGNKQFEQKYDRFGDPNGRFTSFNNGPGTGGGQGTGTGTGQGSGRGTGAGSGIGSGFGSGIGNGNGNGTGNGEDGNAPPPRAVGESAPLRIVSKPKATFTNEARQANFTGTVMLRVTFLANGSIGGVSAIKGAPYGLTEQAIAAAHNIRFEPAKVNGVPQTVTKSVEYSFTLY
jgi:TonB family protein